MRVLGRLGQTPDEKKHGRGHSAESTVTGKEKEGTKKFVTKKRPAKKVRLGKRGGGRGNIKCATTTS